MIAVVSILFSGLATLVALAAFGRIVFQGLPTVEFLVECDNEAYPPLYKLSVSNPTRRLLVLDYIEVLSPDTVTGFVRPELSLRGTIARVWDDLSQADRMKSVFCAVPAGEASVHASIHNHFSHERNLNRRDIFKQARAAALAEWRQLAA